MSEFSVEVGLVVFTRDGGALFGWRDRETGFFYGEADGLFIPDAVAAIEFHTDVLH